MQRDVIAIFKIIPIGYCLHTISFLALFVESIARVIDTMPNLNKNVLDSSTEFAAPDLLHSLGVQSFR